MKQSKIANQLDMSSSTVQRYRNDINMLSPYRISKINTKKRSKKALNANFDNISHHGADVKRLKMTSNDLKRPRLTSNGKSRQTKTKNILKGGSIPENIEFNEHYLDKILKNINS